MTMKHAPIPKKIKLRALELDLTQTDIARIISSRTGKFLSPKRLNDMIHGLRSGEWVNFHLHVADILDFIPREIRDINATSKK